MPPKFPPGRPYSDATHNIRSMAARNETNPCSYKGSEGRCFRPREGLSPYCGKHYGRVAQHGHPDGRGIRLSEYRVEDELVENFLRKNATHKGVQAAERFFSDWMKDAQLGDNVPGKRDMAYMADQGVTGADCVQAAASLWVFAAWHPGKLPDDQRLTFALALAVIHGCARKRDGVKWRTNGGREGTWEGKQFHYRWITTTARRAIGQCIRENIGVFLINLTNALAAEEAATNQVKTDLRTGFNTTAQQTEKGDAP